MIMMMMSALWLPRFSLCVKSTSSFGWWWCGGRGGG